MYMTVKQVAEKWGTSDRCVRILYAKGKVSEAYQRGAYVENTRQCCKVYAWEI
jgi:hypothetical protein